VDVSDGATRIEVHIEELVLHGFSPHARAGIGDAVEAALAAQLAEPGALGAGAGFTADRGVDRADGGAITAGPASSPAAAGAAIAGAITAAIGSVR
jgi:hypothetical protein